MSDNILSQSTDLGVGSLTVGHLIEIRNVGKPLLTIHYDGQITVAEHLKPNEIASEVLDIMKSMNMADPQATKIRELQSDVTQLENRLRALWDKLEGERKFYDQRIRELEIAGNAMYAFINPPSPSMRTIRMDNLLQGWDDAKIGKEVRP
jgi:hypothetical protein